MFFELTRQQRYILKILSRMLKGGRPFNAYKFYTAYARRFDPIAFWKAKRSKSPASPKIDFDYIASACDDLMSRGYIKDASFSADSDLIENVVLAYGGKAYREQWRLYIWRFLLCSVALPIGLSIASTLLTLLFKQPAQ